MAKLIKLKKLDELAIGEPNLLHIQESYLRQVAHGTPLTARRKSKSEVRATGAKWYRQKGTGRARQGEMTNPHMEGGGLAFPPRPRIRRKKLNKHVRRNALRSALMLHMQEGTAHVIQGEDFLAVSRTKDAAGVLSKISGYETICLVIPKGALVWQATRNIFNVRAKTARELNVRDLVESGHLVFAQAALDELKGLLAAQGAEAGEAEEVEPVAGEESDGEEQTNEEDE